MKVVPRKIPEPREIEPGVYVIEGEMFPVLMVIDEKEKEKKRRILREI